MQTATALEPHRKALTGHCYRMLGSAAEADDAVQETMVRAWRNLETFEERASVKTWLYRIATNVCLDTLADRTRRHRPMELGPVGSVGDALETHERAHWLEPIPDSRVLPTDADPSEIAVLRQSIRLAFVAALQRLPPRQRAALLLTEVVGLSANETAETLEMSLAAVNSALQRARVTMQGKDTQGPADPLSAEQRDLVDRYVDAFERYDIDTLVGLFKDDATLSMPPYDLWLQGHEKIRAWLVGPGAGCRGSRLVRTSASGSPAFGQYRIDPAGGHKAWALVVLEVAGDKVVGLNSFLDVETLFPLFGLSLHLAQRT